MQFSDRAYTQSQYAFSTVEIIKVQLLLHHKCVQYTVQGGHNYLHEPPWDSGPEATSSMTATTTLVLAGWQY